MGESRDGLGLAGLVRRGEASAAELVEEAIAAIDGRNGGLNAVITPTYDRARAQARQPLPPGPFAGVPFLVKDLNVAIPGVPLSNGSRAFRGFVPRWECDQARMIREAGFVVVGKTNTSELGASAATNPREFGPTRNPWDPSRNSGGSSGGSAAAVAARLVPLASASDGGGSIRLPASHCGVFGFKPGRGRNPHDSRAAWGGAVVSHAITVSVRDSAAYLDWSSARIAVEAPDRPRPGSFLAHSLARPRPLRIGLCTDSPTGGPVHPDCLEAVAAAGRLLDSLGHRVEPCPLPYDGRALLGAFLTVVAACSAKDLADLGLLLGTVPSRLDLELFTRFMAECGRGVTPDQREAAAAAWRDTAGRMRRFHERTDILLTPVAATPPHGHDALLPRGPDRWLMAAAVHLRLGRRLFGPALLERMVDTSMTPLPFTALANATGQPAMSVPLHWTAGGLPVGAQFIAAPGEDGLLFGLAAQLEEAAPWAERQPPAA